jgi:two-component system, NarL family, response regulator NreC
MAIRVLIADDHGVLRAGLRALLRAESDLEVAGEAADGSEALALALKLRPDVMLADISMPGATGIEVAKELRDVLPGTRVLILTMHEDGGLLQEALRLGAAGYIVKRAVETELIQAIHTVAAGEIYIDKEMRWAVPAELLPAQAVNPVERRSLSAMETDLLRLLARGHTSRQIADTLQIDPESVEQERARLLAKLGLRGRVDLVRYARDQGLV